MKAFRLPVPLPRFVLGRSGLGLFGLNRFRRWGRLSRVGRWPLAAVLGVLLVGGLTVLLALNTASAALELQQRGIVEGNATAADEVQQLQQDLDQKRAPTALASAAAVLGLVPNAGPAFLQISGDGSAQVRGVAAPASVPAPLYTPPVSSPPAPAPAPAAPAPAAAAAAPAAPAPAAPAAVTPGPVAPAATALATPAAPAPATATPKTAGAP